MKKLFIIGTGRNGSKLISHILSTSINNTNMFGEVHGGIDPVFFKNVYMEKTTIEKFKSSRDSIMSRISGIYVEKNHLVVPILNNILDIYPDAVFLYVSRNKKDIIRSLYSRNIYEGHKNKYEEGRLSPNNKDKYYSSWKKMNKFEKVCWYVYTMTTMCDVFLNKLPESQYRIIAYDDFVKERWLLKFVFDWLNLDFNMEKVNGILDKQIGSSVRSENELNFKVNKNKIKNTQHWKDWSKEKKTTYGRFFEK